MKSTEKAQKTEPPAKESFTPFDYAQSDLKVFDGRLNGFIFVFCCNIHLLIFASANALQAPKRRTTHSLIQIGKHRALGKRWGSSFLRFAKYIFKNRYFLHIFYSFVHRGFLKVQKTTVLQETEVCHTSVANQTGKHSE